MPPRLRLPRRRSPDGGTRDGAIRASGRAPQPASVNGGGPTARARRRRAALARAARAPEPPPPRARSSRSCASRSSSWASSLLAFVSWIFGIMMAVASDLPQLENRAQFENAQNSVVYDINGEKIATLTNNQGRILIDSADIAPVMKEATVAIEDQRFYEHRGIDYQGIGRAVVPGHPPHRAPPRAARRSPSSSSRTRSAPRAAARVFEKLREAALAYQLERHWDKDKILTEYLNEIYFGEGAYGIEAAAKTYFGWNHPGCGSAAGPLRVAAPSLGGGDARRA